MFSREAQPSAVNFGIGISDFGYKGKYFPLFVNPKSEIPDPKSP
jgi:hypothetical protein